MKVAVSFLKGLDYKSCIKKIDESNCDYIHVDLCDGKYVEEKNITVKNCVNLLKNTSKKLDVHLMWKEPHLIADNFALLNTECVTIHPLACKDPFLAIETIKNMGLKVGIAINPDEEIDLIMPYLNEVDEVLVMSVMPGKGGQSFIIGILDKLDEIISLKEKYNFTVSVDGGINDETINYLKDKDIDKIVSGSFVTAAENYNERISILK